MKGGGGTEGNACSDMGTVVTAFLEEQDDAGIHSRPHTECGPGNDTGDRKPTPLIAKVTGSRPQGRRHSRGWAQKRPKGRASALPGAAGAAGPRVLSQARTLPPFSFPKASPPPFLQFSVWGITWWILKPLKERATICM